MHKLAMSLPVVAAGLLAILLIGCSDETSPTPITTPTPSPVPTATPEPTATPSPVPTPTPTVTPSPVPTPIPTPQAAKSPPPTWIFAGDISEEHRTILRDEMEAVRAWFSAQQDVEASHFTVLVGATAEELAPEFRDVAGRDLLGGYVPPGYSGPSSLLPDPYITTADDGRPIMVLIYEANPFDELKDSIAHEYFHVLQHQLLASRHDLSDVEPYWLEEGTAQYADHAYSQSRSGRRPFIGDRFSPYEDLDDAINLKEIATPRYLEFLATETNFRSSCDLGGIHPIFTYAFAFAGAQLLVEKTGEGSIVDFWKLLEQRPTWQQAFEEAFGMAIEDFYGHSRSGSRNSYRP